MYNLVPPPGVAAEFGYVVLGYVPVVLQESVRTGSDYGITTTASNVSEQVNLYATKVTIWGVPAEAAHNDWRGSCVNVAASQGLRIGSEGVPNGLEEGEDELEGPLSIFSGGSRHLGRGLPKSTGVCATGQPLGRC